MKASLSEYFTQQLFLSLQEEQELVALGSIEANNLVKSIKKLLPALKTDGPTVDLTERPKVVFRKDPAQPGKLVLKFSAPVKLYVLTGQEAESFCAALAKVFKWRKAAPSKAKPKPPLKTDRTDEARERYNATALADYHARRAYLVQALGGKCVTCGLTENLITRFKPALAVPVKSTKKIVTCSPEQLQHWLPMLELVCRRKHEGEHEFTHGMWYAAYKHKCKCDDCAEYRANYALERREDRRAKKLVPDDASC